MADNQASLLAPMTLTSVMQTLSVIEKLNKINDYDAYDTYDACFDHQFERVCK